MKCEICKREHEEKQFFEKHHLTPKQKGGKHMPTITVCRPCGQQIHKLFTNAELKNKYHTLDALLNNKQIQKWVSWINCKPMGHWVCMKTKKRRK